MKSFLLFFTLSFIFSITTTAQETARRDVDLIATSEAAAHAKLLNRDMSSLTLASGNYTVNYYKCNWTIDPAVYYISGKVTVYFTITSGTSQLVFDLSSAMHVDSIYMRKTRLSYSQSSNQTLTVQLPKSYKKGKIDSVAIYYQGAPIGSGFGSFIQSYHNGTPVIWTLSEPYGARDWWPCRNGLDDKADSIDIYVKHPSAYKTSSNGVLVSAIKKGSTTTTHYKSRYPIASYLVAFAVTNYSVFTDNIQLGSSTMPVISYVYPEDSAIFHSNTHFMLDAMHLYNDKLAPYPFINERYGQTEFGWGGGMEHQTNSFIISVGENLMAHELAHQWFGDAITCGSWQDIWLNEGFATFCADFLYTETYHPTQLQAYVNSDLSYVTSAPNGSVKVDDTTSVGRIFDGRLTYDKGAFLLRMLRWTLGDSAFFAGITNYQSDPKLKYNFARTFDFKTHLEAASGKNLTYFFDQWFTGQGYPSFTVNWNQDAGDIANINISQTTSDNSVSFFKVPLALQFKNGSQTKTIIVNDSINNQSLTEAIGFTADTVLIDPDSYLISKNNSSIKTAPPVTLAAEIAVSPNPFSNSLHFTLPAGNGKKVLINLCDMNGRIVTSKTTFSTAKSQVYSLDLPANVKTGTYILRITVDGKSTSQIVIKQ